MFSFFMNIILIIIFFRIRLPIRLTLPGDLTAKSNLSELIIFKNLDTFSSNL